MKWISGEHTAIRIFRHLGMTCTEREHGPCRIFTGIKADDQFGNKLEIWIDSRNPRSIALQFRTRDEDGMSGTILYSCNEVILKKNGRIEIRSDGGTLKIFEEKCFSTIK
ncbi:MAG: hypothetical protein AAB539_01130 [Patescibacteria group bacterium]